MVERGRNERAVDAETLLTWADRLLAGEVARPLVRVGGVCMRGTLRNNVPTSKLQKPRKIWSFGNIMCVELKIKRAGKQLNIVGTDVHLWSGISFIRLENETYIGVLS